MQKLLIASMLVLAACSTPSVPDPRVEYPSPPEELIKDLKPLEPLNAGE